MMIKLNKRGKTYIPASCRALKTVVIVETRTGCLTQFMPCVGGCPTDVGGSTYVT